jgi:adenosylcobinamide amidohydrolase
MQWESLMQRRSFDLRRSGRFVIAALLEPHVVLSTSFKNGGLAHNIRWLVNHQSCEGTGHADRHQAITDAGMEGYHDSVCGEIGLPPAESVVMGTAANMNYVAVATAAEGDVEVTAAVTAGVEGNATAAGEPATWRETAGGIERVPAYAGTINTILHLSQPLTAAALARAVMTMTEGKSAALQRLTVPSKLHVDLATGTGTDQYCVAAPTAGSVTLTSSSPHMELGELIGRVTRDATMEALRWQNGLEVSYTRGVFHALGRFGVRESTVFDDIAPYLSPETLDLLRKNSKSVFYEPLVGAAAHALAAVCDRIRHGTLPASVAPDAMAQQAAAIAANLAAQLDRWPEFRARLRPHASGDVKLLVLRAVALGWTEKWTRNEPAR